MPPRRSLDETKALLLDVGVRMLVDGNIPVTLGNLSLIDVCREAGLKTAGSGYKIWPNQEDFRAELLHHLLDSPALRTDVLSHLGDDIALAFEQGSYVELIRRVCEASASANIENSGYTVYVAVWLASRLDPSLLESLRVSDTELLQTYADIYAGVVAAFEREFVPPFDAMLLSVSISALVEGMALRAHSNPDLVPTDLMRPTGPGGTLQPWHLFACGVQALFETFTRPIGHHNDAPADQSA